MKKKSNYAYYGIFKDEICEYLRLRASQGHRSDDKYILSSLDVFLSEASLGEKTLTPDSIDVWINSLSSKISVNTLNNYISHYRQFARYLLSIGIPAYIPESAMGDKSYIPYIFSQEELSRIFAAVDRLKELSRLSLSSCLQFPIVLRILYGCGMRIGEVLALKLSDVDWHNGVITVRGAKGNRERLVPMAPSLAAVCLRYRDIIHRNSLADQLLFPNQRQNQRIKAWARKCFRYTLRYAKIESPVLPKYSRNICVHCLRHTFAVNSFRQLDIGGIDCYAAAPILSEYMGHATLDGTETYLHMSAENSQDIVSIMSAYTAGIFPEVPA